MEDKIVQKATELFLNLGFKNVTMDQIAKESGISKKTIYQFFNNKTALIENCLENILVTIGENIQKVKSKNLNAVEEQLEVKKLLMQQMKLEKTSPHYQLQKYYPNLYTQTRNKHVAVMHNCTAENLAKGIKEGVYRKEVNIELTTKIHFICAIELKNAEHFPPDQYSAKEIMNIYTEHFLRSVVTPKGLEILEQQLKQQ